ncbi:MAG: M23 family metallopeptidase [Myxococcota bacterium]
MYRPIERPHPLPPVPDLFGIRSREQLARDLKLLAPKVLRAGGEGGLGLSTLGLFRPELSFPAHAGLIPRSGVAPIFNLFDRFAGGLRYRYTATRRRCRDFRGGRLSYDEHDGTDLVCPPGIPVVAAAPGILVHVRERFIRGGLTAMVDHGNGVVTQYSHLSKMLAEVGSPLRRDQPLALSGISSVDMVAGFPCVPPHVHFMVWVRGRPVDPFVGRREKPRAGTWLHGNEPETSPPLPDDPEPPRPEELCIEERVLDELLELCVDPDLREEIEQAPTTAARAALVEDCMHHDRDGFRTGSLAVNLRAGCRPGEVRLTVPLPSSEYRGAAPADSPFTRPRRRFGSRLRRR